MRPMIEMVSSSLALGSTQGAADSEEDVWLGPAALDGAVAFAGAASRSTAPISETITDTATVRTVREGRAGIGLLCQHSASADACRAEG